MVMLTKLGGSRDHAIYLPIFLGLLHRRQGNRIIIIAAIKDQISGIKPHNNITTTHINKQTWTVVLLFEIYYIYLACLLHHFACQFTKFIGEGS